MAKPVIFKRNDQGRALTFTEVDSSLQNLKDATISVSDGTGTVVLDLNDTLTLSAGTGISYSVNAGTKTVEIAATETQNLFNQIATDDSTIVADAVTDTLTLSGGTAISVTGVAATDTITFSLDDTAVTPGSYAMANITVDQQGRITTASSTEIVAGTGISLSQDSLGQIVINATVTGILPVANGGTGVTTSTGSGSVVLSNSPSLVTPALGTPSSGTLTNVTGLPIVDGTTGTLSVARGGTGTASPALVAGTSVTISGSWPNQTINATVTGITNPMVSNLDVNGFEIFNGSGNDVEFTDNILVGTNGVIRISELVTSNRIECSDSLIIVAHQGTFGGAVTGPKITIDETANGGVIIIGKDDDPDDKIYLVDVVNLGSLTGTQITNLTNPQNGDLVYNSTTNKFQGRANGSWVDLH